MDSCPDSAVLTLGEITNPRWLSRPNRALYCLLSIQAADKAGLPLPSDSLIDVAVNYYSRHLKDSHAVMAYYYQSKALNSDETARLEALLSGELNKETLVKAGYIFRCYGADYMDALTERPVRYTIIWVRLMKSNTLIA